MLITTNSYGRLHTDSGRSIRLLLRLSFALACKVGFEPTVGFRRLINSEVGLPIPLHANCLCEVTKPRLHLYSGCPKGLAPQVRVEFMTFSNFRSESQWRNTDFHSGCG